MLIFPAISLIGVKQGNWPFLSLIVSYATATIPLPGAAESLNVAMAGTIVLYDWRRSHGIG